MVLDGIGWYWMVLDGIGWCLMVLDGIGWYYMVLDGIAWYWMVLPNDYYVRFPTLVDGTGTILCDPVGRTGA